ncbi:hypothetical protein FHS43_000538 [Streptosporangium becharense]|uniref:Uncharacterized protein n=1 Tax=Streptosporangium becharense TaxID=1816182 RepID=A0A7W9INV2_9ACTN|nr:hypothetical protein [Streptosporangium becharense]MBB5823805.1 hypothetical protein [Streptosporangium becharense]
MGRPPAAPRVVVALLLVAGAWIRPVCRTSGCRWRGHAHRSRPVAEAERQHHIAWHALQPPPLGDVPKETR